MSKYNEAIDKVVVTDDMRSRILQNISDEFDENQATSDDDIDVNAESYSREATVETGKVINFSKTIRKVAAVAAVFIAAVGVSAVFLNNPQEATNSATSLTEMASEPMAISGTESESASAKNGPEAVTAVADSVAEIRKADVEINGISVTLEYAGTLYYRATWEDASGEHEYVSESGISLEDMKKSVESEMEK